MITNETINEKVSTMHSKLRIEPSAFVDEILTDEVLNFLMALHQNFNGSRLHLLEKRKFRQQEFDQGKLPDFDPKTKHIRTGEWLAADTPKDLLDRRVEITGPVDKKMIINALNSGASTFMADLEDSNSPIWSNILEGQKNLTDALNKTIYLKQEDGKEYKLNDKTAVLIVRPRGLHLEEKNIKIGNENLSGSLVDFGLYFFRNAKLLLTKNSAPYYYLPKLEHFEEAKWWNDVFEFSQNYISIPNGTIKATVLVETITASFYLNEIIYVLKNHIVGLNCGRWDYIFSFIKKLHNREGFFVPDRSQITMESPFMAAYCLAVIETCHKRNIHAMGGMAAQIPIKNNEEENKKAFDKVRKDKYREVQLGHDGTWVAHPGLVAVAKEIFDAYMPTPNQKTKHLDSQISQQKLIEIPKGTITEKGVRDNVNVGILYIESWLSGKGAAALYNLMEDAATAEICRTQIWLWLHKQEKTENGTAITKPFLEKIIEEEVEQIKTYVGENYFKNGKFTQAIQLFKELIFTEVYEEFLTLKAYSLLKN